MLIEPASNVAVPVDVIRTKFTTPAMAITPAVVSCKVVDVPARIPVQVHVLPVMFVMTILPVTKFAATPRAVVSKPFPV